MGPTSILKDSWRKTIMIMTMIMVMIEHEYPET